MPSEIETIAETPHLRFVRRDGWDYVERPNANGVVCIVARTDENKILLVEQFRPPVGCNVIEFPAGLSGDLADQPEETLEEAARRELLEETGYQAKTLTKKAVVASSAGLTNEIITMFIAHGLEKVAEGGGDEGEEILLHEVPLEEADAWLAHAQSEGKPVDGRVYAGLYFLGEETPTKD